MIFRHRCALSGLRQFSAQGLHLLLTNDAVALGYDPFLSFHSRCRGADGSATPRVRISGVCPQRGSRLLAARSTSECGGELAEAQRINPEYAPRFGPIRLRAGFAMAEVSGCKVKEVRGDQALATGLLDCGEGGPKVRPGLDPLDCIPVRGTQTTGFADLVSVDLDCYPA